MATTEWEGTTRGKGYASIRTAHKAAWEAYEAATGTIPPLDRMIEIERRGDGFYWRLEMDARTAAWNQELIVRAEREAAAARVAEQAPAPEPDVFRDDLDAVDIMAEAVAAEAARDMTNERERELRSDKLDAMYRLASARRDGDAVRERWLIDFIARINSDLDAAGRS